jgi:hypothetical protein
MRLRYGAALAFIAMASCASTQETTPSIAVSSGAKARIVLMDRLRHHGEVRRWLPRVTVEEVDDDAGVDLPAPDEDGSADAGIGGAR